MPDSVWSPEVDDVILGPSPAAPALISHFPSPADWRDVSIYFLLVDRFANPDAPPNNPPWDGEHGTFQGGTFAGIKDKLDYLRALGVGAIWLSPIFKNCQYSPFTYHGYGFQDLLRVEPRFTSEPVAALNNPDLADRELTELIQAAHARGIYVILDIVLNHAGDVFEYEGIGSEAPWQNAEYTIRWRDSAGAGRPEWHDAPIAPERDAAIWPKELRRNDLFRRKGRGGEAGGDFASLKEFATDHEGPPGQFPARSALIRAYQYLLAKFDVDGYRIDTLKYIERDFARVFGNAMREFALSIVKKNFFTFGEAYDDEETISRFVGRFATDPSELVGVDAALDFPLFYRLPNVVKGISAPSEVIDVYEHRKQIQRQLISSHGEASRFFVTFLDNHDQHQRIRYEDPADPSRYDNQLTLAVGCLFTLQGIPCLYYGTEQGLHGAGNSDSAVREALWGRPNAFDQGSGFFTAISELARVRAETPALRYGRQYFRPISGNGHDFGVSTFHDGVLAFSRILNESEVVIAANLSTSEARSIKVLIDRSLSEIGAAFKVLYSNQAQPASPGRVSDRLEVALAEVGGGRTSGPISTLKLALRPMEIQILAKDRQRG
jgi:glycosidase